MQLIIQDAYVAICRKLSTKHKLNENNFSEKAFETLRNIGIFILCFDSNCKLWLATGKINKKEIYSIDSLTTKLMDTPGSAHALRIALMHHHPLPIPYTKEEGITSFEPLLILRNAGTLLGELTKNNFDLVLHGHRHYKHFYRLKSEPDESNEMGVLSASSSTKRRNSERNSYNIITIYKNGRVLITHDFLGTGPDKKPKGISLFTREGQKVRAFERNCRYQGYSIDTVTKRVSISKDGTADHRIDYGELKVIENMHKFSQQIKVYIDKGKIVHADVDQSSKLKGITFQKNDDNNNDKCLGGIIIFGYAVSHIDQPLSFSFESKTQGAFAMTKEEYFRAVSSNKIPIESTEFTVKQPIKALNLVIDFAEKKKSWKPFLQVYFNQNIFNANKDGSGELIFEGGSWDPDPYMQEHEKNNLIFTENGEWALKIKNPIVGYKYSVSWELSGEKMPINFPMSDIKGETDAFSALLTNYRSTRMKRNGIPIKRISEIINALYNDLYKKFCGFGDETFCVTFMTYDRHKNSLEIFEGLKKTNGRDKDISWDFVLEPGVGNAGIAYKRGVPITYIANESNEYIYVASKTGTKYEVLYSVPLYHPTITEYFDKLADKEDRIPAAWKSLPVIGVINVGSDSSATKLRKLKHETENRNLRGVIHAAFNDMLKTLKTNSLQSAKDDDIVYIDKFKKDPIQT